MRFEPYLRLGGILVVLAALLTALGKPPAAHGKAYFAPPNVMVASSDAIAIVQITEVQEIEAKGDVFDFREIARAEVETVLKGSLQKEILLHGNETFICAQVRFQPGRYLVFLRS